MKCMLAFQSQVIRINCMKISDERNEGERGGQFVMAMKTKL